MHAHPVGTGVEVPADRPVDVVDHEVDVERARRDSLEGLDDRRTDREVGHEVAVHDVDVDEVRAA